MKVNPLTLGVGKLRSATNLAFEEGGIKTRPTFKYEKLNVKGQFQGAAEYNLAEGISAESFGTGTGMAIVADGKISVGCEVVGVAYSCDGDVNVYPAENYIIFQNEKGATFWWDGTQLVQSPATITQDWDDPETDFNEVDLTPPVADIPNCEAGESSVVLTFTVLDHVTSLPVEGALVEVFHNALRAYSGFTDANGKLVLNPLPRDYRYTVVKDGYESQGELAFAVDAEESERVFDTCTDPQIILTGETDVLARLVPIFPDTCIGSVDQTYVSDTVTILTFTNVDDLPRRVYSITGSIGLTFDTTFPAIVPANGTLDIEVTGAATLGGETFTVTTECGDTGLAGIEFDYVEQTQVCISVGFDYSATYVCDDATGSLIDGFFYNNSSFGFNSLQWTGTEWAFTNALYVPVTTGNNTNRLNPSGYYWYGDPTAYPSIYAIVSAFGVCPGPCISLPAPPFP
jgi:hypothetical protein